MFFTTFLVQFLILYIQLHDNQVVLLFFSYNEKKCCSKKFNNLANITHVGGGRGQNQTLITEYFFFSSPAESSSQGPFCLHLIPKHNHSSSLHTFEFTSRLMHQQLTINTQPSSFVQAIYSNYYSFKSLKSSDKKEKTNQPTNNMFISHVIGFGNHRKQMGNAETFLETLRKNIVY